MGNLCLAIPLSPKGASHGSFEDHPTAPFTPVHNLVAINRNGWSQCAGTTGRNQSESLVAMDRIGQPDDVLVVQTGAEVGQTALVDHAHEGCNCHALIIMTPRPELIRGAFLELYLRSDIGRKYMASIQTGALHPHLNCTIIRDLYIPTPPTLREQDTIIDYVVTACAPIERAKAQNERSISLLTEYRQALITNAVTGKINVRAVAQKEGAA
jgi:restriction endonuclease S subunit